MSKREFLHSTPAEIELRLQSRNSFAESEIKQAEYRAWLNGYYVQRAILSALNGEKSPYPKNPLEVRSKDTKEIAKNIKKTEEQLQQELAYATLLVKKANANIVKKRKLREKPETDE